MTQESSNKKSDKAGYEDHYSKNDSILGKGLKSKVAFTDYFRQTVLTPFFQGGTYKGRAFSAAVESALRHADNMNVPRNQITILDAGCGVGRLAVYFACLGFNVIGVDISEKGCQVAKQLAADVGVSDHCTFLPESLEATSVEPDCVDIIIGFAALHHFIKYEGVPDEFERVMKPGAIGIFVDAFAENPMYRLFHDKEKMERLGDVLLNSALVHGYFLRFNVSLRPVDWFVMLDKLYTKLLPKRLKPLLRRISRLHYSLDRLIPQRSRIALWLSGTVIATIVLRK